MATRAVLQTMHTYRPLPKYYFFGKHLLNSSFYSYIPLLSFNLKTYFRNYFTISKFDAVSSKRSFRFRRPINIKDRQLVVMRRIRENLCSLFFNDPKRS